MLLILLYAFGQFPVFKLLFLTTLSSFIIVSQGGFAKLLIYPFLNSCLFVHCFLIRVNMYSNGEQILISLNGAGIIEHSYVKRTNLDSYLAPYRKMYSKQIIGKFET